MVFQQFNLFPHKTVKQNIMLAPVELKLMTKDEASKKADELLARVGLPDKANAYPDMLSGGQKQRIAIARSLAMNPDENVMYSFVNGDIDVLVSTTIIETGLDISNVNTMIIHDSDRYGLSQLYQLRGRIGRSNRTAYAFLMYRKNVMLKETAEKRLAAIREYTDLGSGFKIAMRDLELRGAGNLLGAQQHGHMNAVGYDLYCKMLNEAVKEAKRSGTGYQSSEKR